VRVGGAVHERLARAARPSDTDWAEIDTLYAALERLTPSPVVTLNRAVAVDKVEGPAAALEMMSGLVGIALVVTYTRLRRPHPVIVRIVVVAVVLFPVALYLYDLALRAFVPR